MVKQIISVNLSDRRVFENMARIGRNQIHFCSTRLRRPL